MPQDETKLRDGRIVRSESPLNLEMPFSNVDSFVTPTKSFYVRTHFPIPAIDRNAWWLQVEGEDLPPEHGFPVRAIVPGWYAMASVKWLQRITVSDRPFTGYYQTIDYAYWQRSDYAHWQRGEQVAELTPLTEIQVKAQIARPAEGAIVPANTSMLVRGAAWACDAEITKVELSADGGAAWNEAKLVGESTAKAWRR